MDIKYESYLLFPSAARPSKCQIFGTRQDGFHFIISPISTCPIAKKIGTIKKHMRILSMVLAFQNDQSNLMPKTINSLLCVLRAVSDASSQFVNKSCGYIFFKYNFFFQNVLKWPKTDYPHIKKYTIDI